MDIRCRLGSVGRPERAQELQELIGKSSMGCMRMSERQALSNAIASPPDICEAAVLSARRVLQGHGGAAYQKKLQTTLLSQTPEGRPAKSVTYPPYIGLVSTPV